MKYKIGEVARILGTSTDLLRYYEKKGVVKPEKGKDNSYRFYDAWDLNFLTDCLWFKNFGFSIEDIADIVKINGIGELEQLFEDKEDELRAQMRRYELLLTRAQRHRESLSLIKEKLGKCEISTCPAYVRTINRIRDEYVSGANMERLAVEWAKVMPFNQRYFEINVEAFLNGSCDDYRWGYSLTDDLVEALDFHTDPPAEHFPERKCVHTVFKSNGGRNGFAPALLKYAIDYAEANGLRITGTVHGSLLASVMENGELYGYFDAWLPID